MATQPVPPANELVNSAIHYFLKDQIKISERYLQTSLSRNPDLIKKDSRLLRLQSYLALARGDRRSADLSLKILLSQKPDAFLYYLIAGHALDNRYYAQAAYYYSRALQSNHQFRLTHKNTNPDSSATIKANRITSQNVNLREAKIVGALLPLGCKTPHNRNFNSQLAEHQIFSQKKYRDLLWQRSLSPEAILISRIMLLYLANFTRSKSIQSTLETIPAGMQYYVASAKQRKILDANTLLLLMDAKPPDQLEQCFMSLQSQVLPQHQGRNRAIQSEPGKNWSLRLLRLQFFLKKNDSSRLDLGYYLLQQKLPREALHAIRPIINKNLPDALHGRPTSARQTKLSLNYLIQCYQKMNRPDDAFTIQKISSVLFRNKRIQNSPGRMPALSSRQLTDLRLRAGENKHNPEALLILHEFALLSRNRAQIQKIAERRAGLKLKLEHVELPLAYPFYHTRPSNAHVLSN